MVHLCECGYSSPRASNVHRHRLTCRVSWLISNKNNTISLLQQQIRSLTDCLPDQQQLILENVELKSRIAALESQCALSHAQRDTDNVCAFGDEEALDPKEVLPLLRSPHTSVAVYLQRKHFGRPEHRNIKLTNIRGNTIQRYQYDKISDSEKWVHIDKKTALTELTEVCLDELCDKYAAKNVKVWRDWYTKNKFDEDGFDKSEAWKALVKSVEHVLMNN